jgi:hypothetical protein
MAGRWKPDGDFRFEFSARGFDNPVMDEQEPPKPSQIIRWLARFGCLVGLLLIVTLVCTAIRLGWLDGLPRRWRFWRYFQDLRLY